MIKLNKREAFLLTVIDRQRRGRLVNGVVKLDTTEYKIAVKKTEGLDIGCDFKDGKCIVARKGNPAWQTSCCDSCAMEFGYLRSINEYRLDKYAFAWDKKTGFLGPKGCRLEKEDRSTICNGYVCGINGVGENLSKTDRKNLYNIDRSNHSIKEIKD